MTTSIADEISMDGTKPLPSTDELLVMEPIDLVSMITNTQRRSSELKSELAYAKQTHNERGNPITLRRVEALQRAREWHIHLCAMAQKVLGLIRHAEKSERVELSSRRDDAEARSFIRAARRMLSPETYQAIWDEVRRGSADSLPDSQAAMEREESGEP